MQYKYKNKEFLLFKIFHLKVFVKNKKFVHYGWK